jgi:anti-sigma regulatory factor (Ser/Thr protein kinase)
MDTPVGGRQRQSDATSRAAILGSVTVPGEPEQVSRVRGFVARIMARAGLPGVDSEAATLLTSELVTNAILHTDSGRPGGVVTIVVLRLPDGVLIEVVDNGSAGTPVVKKDPLAGEGQGLYLVQQMASQWGYLRDQAGTTVWFHIASVPSAASPAGPASKPRESRSRDDRHHGGGRYYPSPHYADSSQRAASITPAQISAKSSLVVT